MKILTFIILLMAFIFGSCSKQTYLSIAENEINDKIEKSLVCNDDYYYKELQNYFENYLLKNDLIKENETTEQGYYNYLNSVRAKGDGLDKIENNLETKRLKEKIFCSGYNLTFKKNAVFWTNWLVPTISKYKKELINEDKTGEMIYRMGTSDLSEKVDAVIVLDGILLSYEPSYFKKPIMKKIVILDWFVPLEMEK